MRAYLPLIFFAIVGSAAVGQTVRSPANYQKISEVPRGWVWYLNKSSIRPAGAGMYRLWMTGDNLGSGTVRHASRQIKISCTQNVFIPLHSVNYGNGVNKLSETLTGDHASNWTRIETGTPAAAVRPWVCR